MYFVICFVICLSQQGLMFSNHPPVDDNPGMRENFALFYCHKLKSCTPGGDKVCGFDDTKAFLAEFEDLCTLYKVNCEKRGLFRLVEAPICEGQKKYLSGTQDYNVSNKNTTKS